MNPGSMNPALLELNLEQRGALFSLMTTSTTGGLFSAPYKSLAKEWGWSANRVRRLIQLFIDLGLIADMGFDRGRRVYRFEGPAAPCAAPLATPQVITPQVVGENSSSGAAPCAAPLRENGASEEPAAPCAAPLAAPWTTPQVVASQSFGESEPSGAAPLAAPCAAPSATEKVRGTLGGTLEDSTSAAKSVTSEDGLQNSGTLGGTPSLLLLLLLKREKEFFSEKKRKKERRALERFAGQVGPEVAADVARAWVEFVVTREAIFREMAAEELVEGALEGVSFTIDRARKIHSQLVDYGLDHVLDAVRSVRFSRWHCDPRELRLHPNTIFNKRQMVFLHEERKTKPGWVKLFPEHFSKQQQFRFSSPGDRRTLSKLVDHIPLDLFGDGEEEESRSWALKDRISSLEGLGDLGAIKSALAEIEQEVKGELAEIFVLDEIPEAEWNEVLRLPGLWIDSL